MRLCSGALTLALQLIGPDLEEADRQATLFQVLRSIMARKFVAPEIYDIMNKVAEMLVTNQSGHVREVCRAIYLQFLLDYPQGRGRLRDSLAFLAKNLSYEYESGRLSVLELVSAILQKFAAQLIKESADLFFVALVMVVANDDSTRCREMAAELVKVLFSRVEKDTRETLLAMLNTWAGKKAQPQLARTAIQLFGVAIDALGEDGRSAVPGVVDILLDVLVDSEEKLEEAERDGEEVEEVERAWQLPYQALQTFSHVYKAFPSMVSPDDRSHHPLWKAVRGHLLYPHLWVRTSSARLLGTLFAASQDAIAKADLPERHPLATPNLLDMAQKSCLQLKSPALDDGLAMQIVKNLFFAAKCFAARGSSAHKHENGDAGSDDEEEDDSKGAEAERHADPLRWLFTRMSFQCRQAHTHRPSMYAQDAVRCPLRSRDLYARSLVTDLGRCVAFVCRANGLANPPPSRAGSPLSSASWMPPLCNALSSRWRLRSSASPRTRTLKTLKWASPPLVPLRSFDAHCFADPQS